jgi:hypothetical protein
MGARLSKAQVVRSGETRDHLILDTKIKRLLPFHSEFVKCFVQPRRNLVWYKFPQPQKVLCLLPSSLLFFSSSVILFPDLFQPL